MKTIMVIGEKQELTPEQMKYVLDKIHKEESINEDDM
jgi:hypothetical protein